MMQDEASSPPARLITADDHDLVKEGIRLMLAKEPDLVVVGGKRPEGPGALPLVESGPGSAGAAGYVMKDGTKQQLLNAVRRVLESYQLPESEVRRFRLFTSFSSLRSGL